MPRFQIRWSILAVMLLLAIPTFAQTTLPRSTPEAEGLPSSALVSFLDAVAVSPHELHGLVVVRHGKVISEAAWAPYRTDLKHTMYSTSKSFTSTAVGFAVQEKLFSIDDKVISFFPEELPDSVSPYLKSLTIRHLLTMSVGQDPEPTAAIRRTDANWVKEFLAAPIANEPGTKFLYNSLATFMAAAIVQKVTGQTLIEYLTPRLFEPLGIEGADWESDPLGRNTGGWGLRVKTEDMAKLGQLYLQNGQWNGQKLLNADWVAMATSTQIIQHPDLEAELRAASDWEQGYGFQFWRCRHNGFRADGAFGQYILVMPEQDAVIAITSETQNMQGVMDLVWEYLLPAFQDAPLPENPNMSLALNKRIASLALPVPEFAKSKTQKSLKGKVITLPANEAGLENMRFDFVGKQCNMTLTSSQGTHLLMFGAKEWAYSNTDRKGPNLLLSAPGHMAGYLPVEVDGAYRWKDAQTLELTLRYIESPHREVFTFSFAEDAVSLDYFRSDRSASLVKVEGGKLE